VTHTCIVGLGLIGGSIAHALRHAGQRPRVADIDRATVAAARRDGFAAEVADGDGLRAAVSDAATIVLAVPIARLSEVAAVVAAAAPDAPIFHVGGLQRRESLGLPPAIADRVIGTHPMAGSHRAGYAAADETLFEGATVSIESRAPPSVRECAESLWRAAGATRFVYRGADEHDRLVAWVSHLPQLVSTALAATLERSHIDPREGGPGARDTTRLAASPFDLWEAVLGAAPPETVRALDAMGATLAELRSAVAHRDQGALATLWSAADQWATARSDG
jgi:prephenate dehydrogenase